MNINFELKVIPEAKASSQYTLEHIEIQLQREDLPADQREYLEKLKARKYGSNLSRSTDA